MRAVEGLAAEHYRRVISEKTRDALARLRAKGRRVSRFPPYGFRLAPVNPRDPPPGDPRADRVAARLWTLAQDDLAARRR